MMTTGRFGLILLGLLLLVRVAIAQPATVPGVRMQEPPLRTTDRPATYQPSADTLALPAMDSVQRNVNRKRYLSLDVTGLMGRFRRYRIFPGETVEFKVKTEKTHYRSPLVAVSDTAFTIAFQNELYDQPQQLSFAVADVRRVYYNRRIPFVSEAAYLLPAAAVIFVIADIVNARDDNNRRTFHFDSRSLVPAGFLAFGGGVCYAFSHRSYAINDQHRLKVLWTR